MVRWPLILVAGAALWVAGCEQKNDKKMEPLNEAPAPAPSMADGADVKDPYASDPLLPRDDDGDMSATAAPPPRSTTPAAKSTAAPAKSGRTHVVAKGETLSSIARKYYGDASKWKVIFNANRNRIADPNRLAVGTRLIIP